MRYRIREIREFLNMTQEELANKSDVDIKMIAALEGGSAKLVEAEILEKLAKALGATVVILSSPIPPGQQDPLLKLLGYKTLLEMITTEDLQEAKFLLGRFLHDFKGVDPEQIALLSYLFGTKQRSHDIYGLDARGKSFADRMTELYQMGRNRGIYEVLLLSGRIPPFPDITFTQKPSSKEGVKGQTDQKKEKNHED